MPLDPGQTVYNRYRVVKKLAAGGFGAVYQAWDLSLKKTCALKENFETSPQAHKQFEREAVILAQLNHPNLPRVTDHFTIQGQGQYLVMDFVDGNDLQEILDQQGGPLHEEQVLIWIKQICDALTYMHNQKSPIIHRDIKPANIKITPAGNAILVDFGIAKIYDRNLKTTVGAKAVTVGFSPPEQYGEGSTDIRSDVYALGATLYSLLTGQIPVESVRRTTGFALTPPTKFNALISTSVERAILQAVELVPEDRFQTVEAFKLALKKGTRISPESIAVPIIAPVITQPISVQPKRNWIPWAVVGVGMMVILAIGIFLFQLFRPAQTGSPTDAVAAGSEGGVIRMDDLSMETQPSVTDTAGSDQTIVQDGSTPSPTIKPTETISILPTLLPSVTNQPADPLSCNHAGQTWVSPIDMMTLVCVPTGGFLMGSSSLDSLSEVYERPQHSVYLDSFWIDKTEVTNAMFAKFVDSTGHRTQAEIDGWSWEFDGQSWSQPAGTDWHHPLGSGSSLQGLDNHPVVRVSWNDAQAYCSWVERRLPTEAEWEKAARGENGNIYPWGNSSPMPNMLNYNQNKGNTKPVGTYPDGVSVFGAYDMSGNVWEWVIDWYQEYYYQDSIFENPVGPPNGDGRVMRGGSWFTGEVGIRSAYREWGYQDGSYWSTGFRCVINGSP